MLGFFFNGGVVFKGLSVFLRLLSVLLPKSIKVVLKFYVIFYDQDPETTSQNPIKSFTVSNPGAAQKTAYQETLDVNISGDCYIQIVPASPSNSTSNKDRFAIWNITWEKN